MKFILKKEGIGEVFDVLHSLENELLKREL